MQDTSVSGNFGVNDRKAASICKNDGVYFLSPQNCISKDCGISASVYFVILHNITFAKSDRASWLGNIEGRLRDQEHFIHIDASRDIGDSMSAQGVPERLGIDHNTSGFYYDNILVRASAQTLIGN